MSYKNEQWETTIGIIIKRSAEFEQMAEQKFKDTFAPFVLQLRAEVGHEAKHLTKNWKRPVCEDALDETIQGIFQLRLEYVQRNTRTLSKKRLKWLNEIMAEVPHRYELKNQELTKTFCDKLTAKILGDCRKEFDCGIEKLRRIREGEVEDDDNYNVYHVFSRMCRTYLPRYVKEKEGVEWCQYVAYDKVRNGVNRRLETFRQACFPPEFIRKRREAARLGGMVVRKCPNINCRIPWWREKGCKHVFCGVSSYDATSQAEKDAKRVVIPMRGGLQKVHGCGEYFDFDAAVEVTKKEWDDFWTTEDKVKHPKKEEIKSEFPRSATRPARTSAEKKKYWLETLDKTTSYIWSTVDGIARRAMSSFMKASSAIIGGAR